MGVDERSMSSLQDSFTMSVPLRPFVWVSEGAAIGKRSFTTIEGISPFSCSGVSA